MTPEESAQRVYQLLTEALGTHAETRRRAETALREAEEQQDFFASLTNIAVAPDEHAEPQVRFLAAVLGKNAVPRSWRRRVNKNAVTEDERDYVRSTLLSGLGERNSTVSTQLSVWISLVARIDFPKYWPDLMDRLADAIRGENRLIVVHAVVTLDMVLKQLASRRLLADRQALYRVSPTLFALLYQLFCIHLQVLIQGNQGPQDMEQSFIIVVRCMKSFRRILSYGCTSISAIAHLPQVLSQLIELPDVFMRGATGGTEVQNRLSLLAAKLIRVTHERHPVDFQPYLATFLKFYYETVTKFTSQVSSDRTCYHAANFLLNVAQCPLYNINSVTIRQFREVTQSNLSPPAEVSADACRFIVLTFFDNACINALIEAMITRIFVLSKRELETWSSDPETLVREEDAAEWGTENLRHQCEELFKILLIRDKPRVVPMILQLAESVSKDKPLLLDACYRAVGKAVYDVQGAFDFDVWLKGHLGAVLKANCSDNLGERIIQARTAWLVAQFTEQLTRESRQIVNPLLVRLMGFMEQDPVIALTAAKSIQTLVEDLGFHAGDFAQHLQPCLVGCFKLVYASETFETKRDILGTISCLVDRCSRHDVIPVLDLIATSLPRLWDETGAVTQPFKEVLHEPKVLYGTREISSGGETLLRTAIVSLLSSMVKKTGPDALRSKAIHHIVFPVIDYATDPSADKGGAYMMEEGCELWRSIVAASEEYSEQHKKLFTQTERILGIDFDNLREVFKLMEGYVLLGRERFMQEHGALLNRTLKRAVGAVKDRGHLALVEIMEVVLQLFPQEGVRFTQDILGSILRKVLEKDESPVVTAAFVGLLARGSIANVGDMESLVLKGDQEACVGLLDSLIENVDRMFRLPRRKLAVLALCGLTTRYCSSPAVQVKIPLVLNSVVQVLSEEEKRRNNANGLDDSREFENLISRFGEEEANDGLEGHVVRQPLPEEKRKELLKENDPVEKVDLRDMCMQLLTSLKGMDAGRYEEVLRATDGMVLQQLEQLVKK